ncbi:sensor histidine kinase [Pseudobacteroides cellulosolvens]|uniref:histidine kinase n=1 Tax=Pseudobacteroides cellulosolvens ATCC 35603 = DSM 2933 TaxID=398512 RepID=A0A0L6JLN8_9FIRM|nr:ATP-binding protein [Pseudobacteroides cellulosolvens]KNY26292.1 histidine kinase [Pseudobacteroides cellulosolvens ATCC 35603 = DSM 2933]
MKNDCLKWYLLFKYMMDERHRLEDEIDKLTEELLETNTGVLAIVQEFEESNESLLRSDEEKNRFLENLKKANKEQLDKIKTQEKALIQADKMASLGQLVAGVAHEINNPTTYIRSNIELLQKYWNIVIGHIDVQGDERIKIVIGDFDEVIKSMYKGTERIMDIVNGLKFFSRQEKVGYSSVDLFDCLEDSLKLIKNEIVRHKITFINSIHKDRYIINGSKQQLEQVFINLILNSIIAIRKQNESHGCIEIKTLLKHHNFVSVIVSDNGCGIKEENLTMIFNPFYTTYLDEGGTGLGLSIVYGIIKEHQGSIDVFSKLNEGTEIIINLPLIEQNL